MNIHLTADDFTHYNAVASFFARYDVPWKDPYISITLHVRKSTDRANGIEGTYLNLARMNVAAKPFGLYATCTSGCSAIYSLKKNRWDIFIPPIEGQGAWETLSDLDDILMLVLTTGWRTAGWIPVHAGAVTRDETCALVCATSGGGKTTLVSAMVRKGWSTLGDDKILLRSTQDGPTIRALSHIFHLDPPIKRWFPEAKGLENYPAVSPLSDKRRVPVRDLWPEKVVAEARPTHLVQLAQSQQEGILKVYSLSGSDLLSALLSQIAIPRDQQEAKRILTAAVTVAKNLKGLAVELHGLVYRRPDGLRPLMDVLR